tara:strand:+ start:2011 stop:2352 length:342 start_codon:yes stop_codon:yes gene_type:complete
LKDPTIPNVSERKKFMFYDTEKRQTDLRVRLKYDGMNQSHFFRAMISGYLEKDENILNYLDSYKEKNKIQGINKRKVSKKLLKDGEKTKDVFALDDGDIENIFDIIAEEHPDL